MFLIAGPCVIESEKLVFKIAEKMKRVTEELGVEYIFKASFDKANRSSTSSYRGPGVEEGLRILAKVKSDLGLRVLTDVHEDTPIDEVASVVDVLQTPAFLVRQTNFIQKVARAGKPVNIKKGQFQAPWDMHQVVNKCHEVGNKDIWLCDRGTSFGYNTLISDMRGLPVMRSTGCKVVFDATHSVQQPGGQGATSGGQREMVPVLARAAVAVGIDGLFTETHPDPSVALSDGPNMVPLEHMHEMLETLLEIDAVTHKRPFLESKLV
ncbi:3-deoxy-8-phosphooctulonate synthase [Pseudoalteromonas sp. CO342X]|uniref:3-deoxy-8-phosphooctulonate synthase n=1 Tax=Pseudoalteromonas sp. CO342X TaxID=1777270 RepID=UPI001022A980|nr:3-deoxy-8-phosphooctulonate synthase [Pseudoalteromonas sp. CO342X]RZG14246.1 3-deoxy-8-phosphooctulonate synthase [Pseudoalteromonas sp. CO342X]